LFLIVYVGAISILFLFVIMLLHIKKSEQTVTIENIKPFAPAILFVGAVCFGLNDFISFSIQKTGITNTALLESTEPASISALQHYVLNQHSDILSFADILYRTNAVLFFLTSMLLLTAMLGAIVLATNTTELSPETKGNSTTHSI
jgi:NADH:ubiquinone oxidoreductase subunit 6 (subunit J)